MHIAARYAQILAALILGAQQSKGRIVATIAARNRKALAEITLHRNARLDPDARLAGR